MTKSTRMITRIAGISLALAMVTAPAALGAGHTHTVVAFDPDAGELSEGVAVGADGTIYASLSPLGQVARVDAEAGTFEVVGTVPGIEAGDFGLIGITEGPDGAVYGGVFSGNPDAVGVWRIDVSTGDVERIAGSEVISLPNDVAFGADGTMYISDSIGGSVWRVPEGGSAEPWLDDPLLQGNGDFGFPFPIGANGIDVSGDTVYVGVSETLQVVTIPINADGSAGVAEMLATYEAVVDGMAVAADGTVYTAHPGANVIARLAPGGEIEIVAEVGDGLDAPASVALYSDADGNMTAYASNHSIAQGGPLGAGPGVVAIDG